MHACVQMHMHIHVHAGTVCVHMPGEARGKPMYLSSGSGTLFTF